MSENTKSFFKRHDEEGGSRRILKNWNLKFVGLLAISWSLFQLWYASPLPFILDFGKFIDVPARAIHLAFGMSICFLAYPILKSKRESSISLVDFLFASISIIATFYIAMRLTSVFEQINTYFGNKSMNYQANNYTQIHSHHGEGRVHHHGSFCFLVSLYMSNFVEQDTLILDNARFASSTKAIVALWQLYSRHIPCTYIA